MAASSALLAMVRDARRSLRFAGLLNMRPVLIGATFSIGFLFAFAKTNVSKVGPMLSAALAPIARRRRA
jgi:hypothetical protein